MGKRKLSAKRSDLDEHNRERRLKLEKAKDHIQRTNDSVRNTAKLYVIGRDALSTYLSSGFQTIGRPPVLNGSSQDFLKMFLISLDSANMQQTVGDVSQIIQQIAHLPTKP